MKKAPTEPPVRTGYLPDESGAMTDSANAAQEAASFDVRTDLAVEETETKEAGPALSGVSMEESLDDVSQVHITRVVIENETGAQALHKPVGTYITLDAIHMEENNGEYHREISQVLARQIESLIRPLCPHRPLSVLAVGLGNVNVTPDALGPMVLDNLLITRHLKTGQFQFPSIRTDTASVCGIIPGVMAQTGMETAEIVEALCGMVKPDLILVIDALAARSVTRLGTTIQLSDTGIHPGSGVGNHRHSLTQDSLGVPVIAIGVPTVVSAAAIVTDTLDALLDVLRQESSTEHLADSLSGMSGDEKYALVRELLEPRFGPMFVTPKDIDETVKRLSFTISEGINISLFGEAPPF